MLARKRLNCKEDIDKEEVEMMEDESSDPTWEMSTKKDRPKVKLFKCPEIDCKVKMKSKSALKQHIDFVHGNKTINCPESECKAKLKMNKNICIHLKTSTMDCCLQWTLIFHLV